VERSDVGDDMAQVKAKRKENETKEKRYKE